MRRFEPPNSRRAQSQGEWKRCILVFTFAAVVTVVVTGFVAFSVDAGLIAAARTNMQNVVDAAAVAAAQEMSLIIEEAEKKGIIADVTPFAAEAARETAAYVAVSNGVFLDSARDVQFGRRVYDPETESWTIRWGQRPYDTVRVEARRDQEDTSLPDGEVELSFARLLGVESTDLTTSAIAFVETGDTPVRPETDKPQPTGTPPRAEQP